MFVSAHHRTTYVDLKHFDDAHAEVDRLNGGKLVPIGELMRSGGIKLVLAVHLVLLVLLVLQMVWVLGMLGVLGVLGMLGMLLHGRGMVLKRA